MLLCGINDEIAFFQYSMLLDRALEGFASRGGFSMPNVLECIHFNMSAGVSCSKHCCANTVSLGYSVLSKYDIRAARVFR